MRNLPASTGDAGSILGWGSKIPPALQQLNLCSTTTEPSLEPVPHEKPPQWEAHTLQQKTSSQSPRAATKNPCVTRNTQHSQKKEEWSQNSGKLLHILVYYKEYNKRYEGTPAAEIHRMQSGSVPSIGASVPGELGKANSWHVDVLTNPEALRSQYDWDVYKGFFT